MQKSAFSYFWSSIASFVVAVGATYYFAGLMAAWAVAVLSVLEVSLSFDNAVVNAAVLKNWDTRWRKIFLMVGLPIAVFGMRLVFPIVIVSATTGMGMYDAFLLALQKPDEYAERLTAAHALVAGFGGTFLLLVGFEFFIDAEKEHHWLPGVEHFLARLGTYQKEFGAACALLILWWVSAYLPAEEQLGFIVSGILGLVTYVGAKSVSQILAGGDGAPGSSNKMIAQGIGGFMYLEILDASFSFDGVIGAFAISIKLFVIVAGLGVGAMFVRSITILMVEKGTLDAYLYLEHGAFWAILALAIIMLTGVVIEIPETVTGFIGAGLIGAALLSSIRANKNGAGAKEGAGSVVSSH